MHVVAIGKVQTKGYKRVDVDLACPQPGKTWSSKHEPARLWPERHSVHVTYTIQDSPFKPSKWGMYPF